ncbi:uncharacterized protein LOC143305475 isoform X2 [Osmia lignaria lignaria]|uniref:uncharacterized protein LOC143305475 isoform X2 n=1 Tax=Osmia lignaria lignaria TaxID=1437193 RepID=UPI00402B1AF9
MTDTYYRYTASAHVLYYCYNITLYVIQSLNRILPFSKMNSLLTECSSVYHELTSLLAEDVFVAVIFPRYYTCGSPYFVQRRGNRRSSITTVYRVTLEGIRSGLTRRAGITDLC